MFHHTVPHCSTTLFHAVPLLHHTGPYCSTLFPPYCSIVPLLCHTVLLFHIVPPHCFTLFHTVSSFHHTIPLFHQTAVRHTVPLFATLFHTFPHCSTVLFHFSVVPPLCFTFSHCSTISPYSFTLFHHIVPHCSAVSPYCSTLFHCSIVLPHCFTVPLFHQPFSTLFHHTAQNCSTILFHNFRPHFSTVPPRVDKGWAVKLALFSSF